MNTLVAALHAKKKDYSFPRWEAATASYDRLLALETFEEEYAKTLGVPYVLYEAEEHPRRQGRHRICGPLYNSAWKALLGKVNGHTHILCLDIDVIPKGDILAVMESEYDGSFAFLRHGVPWRASYHRPGFKGYETSCTLGSVACWREALARTGGLTTLYGVVGDPDLFTHKDIDVLELEHLDE
jgi:hypothetical protein